MQQNVTCRYLKNAIQTKKMKEISRRFQGDQIHFSIFEMASDFITI
jgi:hypothetical protein